ncbi:hypothetical protein GH714_037668 [Hevea brasiliensis]|uniref:Uncharacterized protein n=1 Tax=Hevea brasiliensis TaxID=3981 RepID=A0A6A6MRX2_HEVBR|nr:hypothetical protein GH714_037668 [Hevea brasiliensis]
MNMRSLLLPATNQLHLGHAFFNPQNILEEIRSAAPPNMLINQPNPNEPIMPGRGGMEELPKPPVVNRPPEKRQRVPSATTALSMGTLPTHPLRTMPDDQPVKKTNVLQQEGEDVLMKDGLFAPANMPY